MANSAGRPLSEQVHGGELLILHDGPHNPSEFPVKTTLRDQLLTRVVASKKDVCLSSGLNIAYLAESNIIIINATPMRQQYKSIINRL